MLQLAPEAHLQPHQQVGYSAGHGLLRRPLDAWHLGQKPEIGGAAPAPPLIKDLPQLTITAQAAGRGQQQ